LGQGLSRTEIKIELSQDQFRQLWPYTDGRRVSKTRYKLQLGEHTAELDQFEGDLAGLFLVEVEFASVEASRQFIPPDWFGMEVTEDSRFKNKQLAVYGIPGK
jgi:CYTH domain-containing protein